jgi:BolA protein
MDYVRKIDEILKESFEPDLLEVIDESELHRGHKGFQEGRQTHFKIVISARSFENMSRVSKERAIHKALGDNILRNIHALSVKFQ